MRRAPGQEVCSLISCRGTIPPPRIAKRTAATERNISKRWSRKRANTGSSAKIWGWCPITSGQTLPPWETERDGSLVPGGKYQRLSVATYATHDHEPLRVLWTRWDKLARAGGADGGPALREMQKLAAFAGAEGALPQPWSDPLHEKLLRALFSCNSWIAICMITDLFASEQRFNVPGAVSQSNWSERLPRTVAGFKSDRKIVAKMKAVRQMLAECQRVP